MVPAGGQVRDRGVAVRRHDLLETVQRVVGDVQREDLTFERELLAVVDAVRNDAPPETHGAVGLAALAVVEAMAESARSGGRRTDVID